MNPRDFQRKLCATKAIARAAAVALIGCVLGACSSREASEPRESLHFTHMYDARQDEYSVNASGFEETIGPSLMRVYVLSEGTEPVDRVGIQTLSIGLQGKSGGLHLVAVDALSVEVVSVEDGWMLLAPFERPGKLDWDGRSVTEEDQDPGAFLAEGWRLAVDRSELRGAFQFDTPNGEHVEVAFTAPLYTDE